MTGGFTITNNIDVDSYFVGYLYRSLSEIAESLVSNDTNKALKQAYSGMKHVDDALNLYKSTIKEDKYSEKGKPDECIK